MKNIWAFTCFIFILTAHIATDSYAGAWTAKQYSFYDKPALNYYYAEEMFNSDGNKESSPAIGTFRDFNISNYFEYGVIDDLTVIASLAYKFLYKETDEVISRHNSLGDSELGARYKLMDNFVGIISSQVMVKIPGAYDKNDDLPLGNGQFDLEPRVQYGRSLYPFIPGYCNIEAGYRWRAGDPSDEFRYLVEVGVDIFRGLYARTKLDGIKSINNGTKNDGSGNPTLTNNYDLGRLDAALGYKITDAWGIEVSYIHPLYGRNTSVGMTYSVGVYYKGSFSKQGEEQ